MSLNLDLDRHAEPAARVLAAIRLWPELPLAGPGTAECCALAVSALDNGVAWSHPQLLIQAAQALSLPVLNAKMCARSQRFLRICTQRRICNLLISPVGRPDDMLALLILLRPA